MLAILRCLLIRILEVAPINFSLAGGQLHTNREWLLLISEDLLTRDQFL